MEIKQTKRGGKRPGAGRPKGVRDRATGEQRASLEELARAHTEVALNALVAVATSGESESARVGAAVALLDRGYGRPRQGVEITGENGGPLSVEVSDAKDRLAHYIDRQAAAAAAAGRAGPTE